MEKRLLYFVAFVSLLFGVTEGQKQEVPGLYSERVKIVVRTVPGDASIFIDGQPVSVDSAITVTVGKHSLKVSKQGYLTYVQDIIVSPSSTIFSVVLEEAQPTVVNIFTEPINATIKVNGEVKGRTNKGIFLIPGVHQLRLELPDHVSISEAITVSPDQSKNNFKYKMVRNKGILDFAITPENAVVKLNGTVLKKPYRFETDPGLYKLEVTAEFYDTFAETINLGVGETATRKVTLVKNSGKVLFSITPSTAALTAKGIVYDHAKELEFLPGRYELTVEAPNYYSQNIVVDVIRGKTEKFNVELKKITGRLQFSVSPVDARVYLYQNNAEVKNWTGAAMVADLAQGEYALVVRAVGYVPFKKIIGINENKTTVEDVQLVPGSIGPVMAFVQGGSFEMGCTSDQSNCDDDEYPSRMVQLQSYYMAKTELTVAEFKEFVETSGYKTIAEREGASYVWGQYGWTNMKDVNWRHDEKGELLPEKEYNKPVIHITWYDAVEYCNWLSIQDGLQPVYSINKNAKDASNKSDADKFKWTIKADAKANGYRLPTEIEWEYAARGGKFSEGMLYSGSDRIDDVAWYASNSSSSLKAVAKKKANGLGIFDMSGNVWEWCWDWYGPYKSGTYESQGPASGTGRVLRGGSWDTDGSGCRVAGRVEDNPSTRFPVVGMRVVAFGRDGFFNNDFKDVKSGSGQMFESEQPEETMEPIALTNKIILDMRDIVKDAQNYLKNRSDRTFSGYSIPYTLTKEKKGVYSCQVFPDMIILTGASIQMNDEGSPVAEVVMVFNKDEIKSTVIK